MAGQVITVVPRDQASVTGPIGTGGLEGADRLSRETATWRAPMGSPDQVLQGVKAIVDARSSDTAQNDAWAQSAITTHRDAIVGAKYSLNCTPDLKMLGVDLNIPAHEEWYEQFQTIVEARWNAAAESDGCWLDVARRRTVTEMCRQAVGSAVLSGEILCAVEWDKSVDRPFKTCVHLVNPARLSNPNNVADNKNFAPGVVLSGGIAKDQYDLHLGYYIRRGFQYDASDPKNQWKWDYVPAALPWGRRQVIYITEPLLVEQTRGVGDMVSALPHMRMAKKHSQIALQKAVVGATYAMALESDLPPPEIAQMMGVAQTATGATVTNDVVIDNWQALISSYLAEVVAPFYANSSTAAVDGAKATVLPPGSKLQMLNADNGGGASYEAFEAALNRKTAAALNMSYEEFTRDYSRVSYSGAKASAGKTERFMNARKKLTADRLAGAIFTLWLEEQIALGEVPLPPTWTSRDDYYKPLMKEAISRSDWIGTGKGQIDELKETQAAVMRVANGFSTRQAECARLGVDWRPVFDQLYREMKVANKYGLSFSDNAQKSLGVDNQSGSPASGQNTMSNDTTSTDDTGAAADE